MLIFWILHLLKLFLFKILSRGRFICLGKKISKNVPAFWSVLKFKDEKIRTMCLWAKVFRSKADATPDQTKTHVWTAHRWHFWSPTLITFCCCWLQFEKRSKKWPRRCFCFNSDFWSFIAAQMESGKLAESNVEDSGASFLFRLNNEKNI